VNARAIAALAVVAMLACNRYKVTVPLDTAAAQQCAEDCGARYRKRSDLRRTCLQRCPGARDGRGRCTADERPPVAACAYDTELSDGAAVAAAVGLIVLVVAVAVGVALGAGADTIDDDPP
jgi:hypothetical protein